MSTRSSERGVLSASRVATWQIFPSVSEQEALRFQESLNHRLGRQLQRIALAQGDLATVARIDRLLKSERLRWTTPAHAWFSYRILDKTRITKDQFTEALGLLEQTAQNSLPARFSCDATRITPYWARGELKLIDEAMTAYHRRPCRSAFAKSGRAWAERRVLQSADLIGEVWPEAAAEINRLVRDVVILTGNSFESSMARETFGAIFVCPQPHWLVAYYVEVLLHETAHHSFAIKSTISDFLKNPGVLAQSPFRRDPRPLGLVLDAAFVLARSAHGIARLLESRRCPQRRDTARFLLRWREKFSRALLTLSRSAHWTPSGERLFKSLRDCCLELPS